MKLIIFSIVLIILPAPALAYVGPGLGLGAIGAVLGFLFSIFLLVLGLLFYPLKRLYKFIRKKTGKHDS